MNNIWTRLCLHVFGAILALNLVGCDDDRPVRSDASLDCETYHPFEHVDKCEGRSDSRGPDPSFTFAMNGDPNLSRCRDILRGKFPKDLVKRGWAYRQRGQICDQFGLADHLKCMVFTRSYDATQIYIEGYSEDCSSGAVVKSSHMNQFLFCLRGESLKESDHVALRQHLADQDLKRRPKVLVVEETYWKGTPKTACRLVKAGDVVFPSFRLDVDVGVSVVIHRDIDRRMVTSIAED